VSALLRVTGLEAGYGRSQVLFGLGFSIAAGGVGTLLGRHGIDIALPVSGLAGSYIDRLQHGLGKDAQ